MSTPHSDLPSSPVLPVLTETLHTEVLVVGGGLVGGALAAALASHGVGVIVLDRDIAEERVAVGRDGRSSAVAGACQRVLAAIGVWPHMADHVQPILDIRVSDTESPLYLHYDHRTIGQPMGWLAENRVLRQAVLARLAELPEVRTLAPARLATLDRRPDGVTATLTDGREIKAALVVGCDGRRSQVRQMAGITVTGWGYGQSALVFTVWHQHPHHGIAHEHFLPSGPFAILPLVGGHHSSLVWTERDALLPGLLALSPEAFHAELMDRFGDFLGQVKIDSPLHTYPLGLQMAHRFVDRRLALVGDAAHGMHPVAGQGMNFGLRDVAELVERVVAAKRLGMDLGSDPVLAAYERRRRPDALLMLGVTDGLVRLFSNDHAPLRLARTAGLAMVNRLPGIKTMLIKSAMGDLGRLPQLMQGRRV